MKPHPRIRKTIKWGGAVVTGLLVVVWIGSMFVAGNRRGPNGWAAAGAGRVGIGWYNQSGSFDQPWFVMTSPKINWSIEANRGRLIIPLWLPVALSLVFTASVHWYDVYARRRALARINLCPKCKYDRAGLAAGAVCPECGSMPA
jgi:hypothetical protein